tara:strand:- start:360 stop:881 length:522 start_codon:yes stop_codon:yes gene_type:complete
VSKIYIGYIAKCHGLDGQFSIKLDLAQELCPLFNTIKTIYIENNEEPLLVTKAILNNKIFLRTKIKTINSRDEVKNILRHNIYIKKGDHTHIEDALNKKNELINFKVFDTQKGDIGTIEDIDFNRPQPLFIIHSDNNKQILIPYVKDFIINIDHSLNIIELNLPEGLIDICTI